MSQRGFQAQRGCDHRLPVRRSEGLLPIYAGAQGGKFMSNERLIDPLEPLGRDLDGVPSACPLGDSGSTRR